MTQARLAGPGRTVPGPITPLAGMHNEGRGWCPERPPAAVGGMGR